MILDHNNVLRLMQFASFRQQQLAEETWFCRFHEGLPWDMIEAQAFRDQIFPADHDGAQDGDRQECQQDIAREHASSNADEDQRGRQAGQFPDCRQGNEIIRKLGNQNVQQGDQQGEHSKRHVHQPGRAK